MSTPEPRTPKLKAFLLGLLDGFRQPTDLSWSTNIDAWATDGSEYEWLDRGINIGQFLRVGTKSEAWRERFWPFNNRKGA